MGNCIVARHSTGVWPATCDNWAGRTLGEPASANVPTRAIIHARETLTDYYDISQQAREMSHNAHKTTPTKGFCAHYDRMVRRQKLSSEAVRDALESVVETRKHNRKLMYAEWTIAVGNFAELALRDIGERRSSSTPGSQSSDAQPLPIH